MFLSGPTLNRVSRATKTALLSTITDSLVILNYHRVEEPTSDANNLSVSVRRFREHMEVLRKFFDPVPLSAINCPSIPIFRDLRSRRRIVVTFDDGYIDTFEKALPILEEFDIPASVFVTTGMVGKSSEFWWDELEELLLRKLPEGPVQMLSSLPAEALDPALYAPQAREELYNALTLILKRGGRTVIDAVLSELRGRVDSKPLCRPENRAVTEKELRVLARHPLIEIGAHTVSHANLGRLPAEDQWQELKQSKVYLEGILGRCIDTIAYPYGDRGDFNQTTQTTARSLGFRFGLSTMPGVVHARSNPYALPRMFVKNWTGRRFQEKLQRHFWIG